MKHVFVPFLKSLLKTLLLAVPHLCLYIITFYFLLVTAEKLNLLVYEVVGAPIPSRVSVKGEIIEILIIPILSAVLLFAFSLFIRFLCSKDNKGIFIKTCRLFRNFCFLIIAILFVSCFFDDWLRYEIRDNPGLFIAFFLITIVISLVSQNKFFTKSKSNEANQTKSV